MLRESGRRKSRCKIQDLLADRRCSQTVLDFLSSTDVGSLVSAEEDAESEASEWELRKCRQLEEERRAEAVELGAAELGAGEELPLSLPMPNSTASADEDKGRVTSSSRGQRTGKPDKNVRRHTQSR